MVIGWRGMEPPLGRVGVTAALASTQRMIRTCLPVDLKCTTLGCREWSCLVDFQSTMSPRLRTRDGSEPQAVLQGQGQQGSLLMMTEVTDMKIGHQYSL